MKFAFKLHLWYSPQEEMGGERIIVRLGELSDENPVPTPEPTKLQGLNIQYPFNTSPAAVVGALLTKWSQFRLVHADGAESNFTMRLIMTIALAGYKQKELDIDDAIAQATKEAPGVGLTVCTLMQLESFRDGFKEVLVNIYKHCERHGEDR